METQVTNLRSTLDQIDGKLGELDMAVNIYSTQVMEIRDMHDFLTEYTSNVDNQVEFFYTLTTELFAELDRVTIQCGNVSGNVGALNDEIVKRQTIIDNLSKDLTTIQERVTSQLNKIDSIGSNVVESNDVLNEVGQSMTDLRNEYNVKKRKKG